MSNIDLIRERLNKLQSKNTSGGFEKIDYSTIFWKPKLGSTTVRIVPRKSNRDFPFAEVSFHQYNVFKKSVYSLTNFGEKDPVVQLVRELYDENTEESKDLAKKISPRTKYYAQVLVRGEENLGIRLWEFNKTTYEKLLAVMANEDYGEIDDIAAGTDLTIEGYNDVVKIGKKEVKYIAVNVTPKRNMTPLASDAALVQSYLENQKDILELYKKHSYEDIKTMLREYLDPKENTSDSNEKTPEVKDDLVYSNPLVEEDEDDAPAPVVQSTTRQATSTSAKSSRDRFKEVFPEEE